MRLLVVGAGGHSKVVVDSALAAGFSIAAVLGRPGDPDEVFGVPVLHEPGSMEADGFIIAVGNNATRASLYQKYLHDGLRPVTVIHPSAVISASALVGEGSFIAPGAIVNCDARIGTNAILNTGCSVDHDCIVGDHAHIAPGVALCGGATVGEGALIGVGSCLAPLTSVGEWATVGAGAAVIAEVPRNATWAGVPARPLNDRAGGR